MTSSNKNQWIAVGIIVALLGGALTAGVMLNSDINPVTIGSEAPDFAAISLETGDTVTMAAYEDQVVLLNLWATWCIPCVEEMPAMQRLHDRLSGEGLRVVAISVDARRNDIEEFIADFGLTFDVLHDRSGRVEGIYQIVAVPETFVIDRQGIIIKKEIGAKDWDSPENVALMRRLMGTTAPEESVTRNTPSNAGEAGIASR